MTKIDVVFRVCKISFKSVQVCGGCCKVFRGLTLLGHSVLTTVSTWKASAVFNHKCLSKVTNFTRLQAVCTLLILLIHPFNGLFYRTTCINRYQKAKTSLDLNKARDDGVLRCTGCKRSTPRSRQITTPIPNHSMLTGQMLFLTPN